MNSSPRSMSVHACSLVLVVVLCLTVGVTTRPTRLPLQKSSGTGGGQLQLQMQQLRRDSEVAMSTAEMSLIEQYLSPEMTMLGAASASFSCE